MNDTMKKICLKMTRLRRFVMPAVSAVILCCLFILLISCSPLGDESGYTGNNRDTVADNGVFDLADWDFSKNGNIMLDGEWEFYWNRFVDYRSLSYEKPELYAEVPKVWNRYNLDGSFLPGEGYASYRLRVRTSLPEGTVMGFRINTFSSAYRLFVNDKLVAANGVVSEESGSETGEYRPQAVVFDVPAPEFDIIIHVSNYSYARGGFWYSVVMGTYENILSYHTVLNIKHAFLLGALAIIIVFYAAVYLFRRELRYTLYFALLCLSVIFQIDVAGQFLISSSLLKLGFNGVVFIWYSSYIWMEFFFILYMNELYPSMFSKVFLRVFWRAAAILQLVYILLPPVIYSKTGLLLNYIDIAVLICIAVTAFIGIRQGKGDAWLNILSIVVLGVTYLFDMLYLTNVTNPQFGEIFYFGVFLFAAIQMIIQALRIKIFHENKTAAELAFLQAQIKPHFVFNTLNTFISIARVDINKAINLLVSFGTFLRKSYDFKLAGEFVPLSHEVELVKAYLEVQSTRFEEKLRVVIDVHADPEILVPRLILQPIVENAVIHGIYPKSESGIVAVSVTQSNRKLHFKVKDTGVGMNRSLAELLKSSDAVGGSTGLSNIEQRLRKIYGKGLSITSIPGVGTEVAWTIQLHATPIEHFRLHYQSFLNSTHQTPGSHGDV